MNTTQVSIIVLVVGVLIGGFLGSQYLPQDQSDSKNNVLNSEEAKAKAKDFINKNLMSPQSKNKAEIKSVSKQGNLYKLAVDIGGQKIDSYMTLDGKIFFPQGMNTEKQDSEEGGDQTNKVTVDTKKQTPVVELFVMSHCPYGTQMEKAILPVVKTLGDKIDFQFKFCDFAMHGEKELKEQMRQHCIKTEEPNKLIPYLECFLETSESDSCLAQTGVNTAQTESCVESVDDEYGIMEKFADKSTWVSGGRFPRFDIYKEDNEKYGISGSPALVVNGEEIKPNRSPSALLTSICSGFENKPSECDAELSSEVPSPGFGSGTSASAGAGQCE